MNRSPLLVFISDRHPSYPELTCEDGLQRLHVLPEAELLSRHHTSNKRLFFLSRHLSLTETVSFRPLKQIFLFLQFNIIQRRLLRDSAQRPQLLQSDLLKGLECWQHFIKFSQFFLCFTVASTFASPKHKPGSVKRKFFLPPVTKCFLTGGIIVP